MRKIVEYERELNNFEAGHQKLNSEIRMGKASNQLIQACITGLFNDQQYMEQLQKEATQVEEQPEEGAEELIEDEDGQIEGTPILDEDGNPIEMDPADELETEADVEKEMFPTEGGEPEFEEELTPQREIITD